MIGIDFSIRSPAITISNSDKFEDCKMLAFAQNKKQIATADNIYLANYPEIYKSKEERYYKLCKTILQFIEDYKEKDEKEVWIEGYAYAATGNVFDIAECTSVLKQLLYHNGYSINIVEPSVAKKFATGKGNANKFGMLEAFKNKTNMDIEKCFDFTKEITEKKIPAPLSDIIDSYWMCQYGLYRQENKSTL
jgi:Holliday junction resolvasome RuvABC endonuclease subunit